MMKISTSRFGSIEFDKNHQLLFPKGILGFEKLRDFVLLSDPEDEIFIWLQSLEKPHIAFPLLEPDFFTSEYNVVFLKDDLEILSLKKEDPYQIFSIITIPNNPVQMTANLKAPLVINRKENRACQLILPDESLSICEPIFSHLSKRMIKNPSLSFKTRSIDKCRTVSLNLAPKTKEEEVPLDFIKN